MDDAIASRLEHDALEGFARTRIEALLAGRLTPEAVWTTVCAVTHIPGFADRPGRPPPRASAGFRAHLGHYLHGDVPAIGALGHDHGDVQAIHR